MPSQDQNHVIERLWIRVNILSIFEKKKTEIKIFEIFNHFGFQNSFFLIFKKFQKCSPLITVDEFTDELVDALRWPRERDGCALFGRLALFNFNFKFDDFETVKVYLRDTYVALSLLNFFVDIN